MLCALHRRGPRFRNVRELLRKLSVCARESHAAWSRGWKSHFHFQNRQGHEDHTSERARLRHYFSGKEQDQNFVGCSKSIPMSSQVHRWNSGKHASTGYVPFSRKKTEYLLYIYNYTNIYIYIYLYTGIHFELPSKWPIQSRWKPFFEHFSPGFTRSWDASIMCS